MVDLRAFRRQHLGFVFQKANLIPFLSALENVQVALEINDVPRRAARKRAMELLDYLGVATAPTTCRTRFPAASNSAWPSPARWPTSPSLILADEPTAALDSQRGRQVMELFAQSRPRTRRGRPRCHARPRALDVFDRILDVEDGMKHTRNTETLEKNL